MVFNRTEKQPVQKNKIQIKEGECSICLFIDTDSEKETKSF